MNNTGQLALLLDALSRKYGLGSLAPDDSGVCVLSYDGILDVMIESPPEVDSVLVQIPLMSVPGADREAFFRRLLALNHRGEATRGAALGLNEASQAVMLGVLAPLAGMDELGFEQLIGNLIDTAQALLPEIAADGRPAPGKAGYVSAEGQAGQVSSPSSGLGSAILG